MTDRVVRFGEPPPVGIVPIVVARLDRFWFADAGIVAPLLLQAVYAAATFPCADSIAVAILIFSVT